MPGAHEEAYRTLEPDGADRALCEEIALESRLFLQRAPLDIAARISTATNLNDRQGHWLGYIQDQCILHEDADLNEAYGDFRRRYNQAFLTRVHGDSRIWISLLEPAQSKLLLQILGAIRDDLVRAETVERKLIILLARTPYALYERLRISWSAHCERSWARLQPPLSFPVMLRVAYLERTELSTIVNNTLLAIWPPARGNVQHFLPPKWHELETSVRTILHHAEHGSNAGIIRPEGPIWARDQPFFQEQVRTCLASFTSEAAKFWFNTAHSFEQLELIQTLRLLNSLAVSMHQEYGPLWTVRFLHRYTFKAFHEQLVNLFIGFDITPMHGLLHQEPGFIAHSAGRIRRDLIYGRKRSIW